MRDEEGLYLECTQERDVWGRMQHIFGLAIHTTPIGHRVSEAGDNSVSVHQRWNMCAASAPPFLSQIWPSNISRGLILGIGVIE